MINTKININEAINFGANELKNITKRARYESEILLSGAIKKDKIYIILNNSYFISESETEIFKNYIFRRKNGEPIEYIIEKVSFYSMNFYISKGALIPRPESEILVDLAFELLKNKKNANILEIGVGSGAVSIAVAIKLQNSKIVAIDISRDALKIAHKNIKIFNLEDRIELIESNLFENIKNINFDLIISNPPYISLNEKGKLQRELDFEPDEALYGGEVGDEVLKKIIETWFLRNEILLLCEMGYDQKENIINFINNRAKIEFFKDLAGFDRGFILKKIFNI
jgi:release factor glutamine methyltransferase